MDPKLSAALQQSNYRATFENQKEKLKEKLKADLYYPYNGGYFELGPLLEFQIKSYLDLKRDRAVILDVYMNPIDIDNLEKFYEDIVSLHHEAINRYRLEFQKLKKARNIKALTDFSVEDDVEE